MSYSDLERTLLRAVGDRVRQYRKKKGWSQEQLSLECGLDRTYVSGVERGARNVAIINLHKIADSLGVPLAELLAGL